MSRRFLNARSPLRLLEKGLHGGLGRGNLGLVLAGPGIGKTSFLVGVALDDLLRGKPVLHVALDHNVQHVRDHYDTVFEDLAASAHFDENHSAVRAEMDRLRRIRVYPHGAFDAKRLREALAVEAELDEWAAAARDAQVEVWLTANAPHERIAELPATMRPLERAFGVILAMEPTADAIALRALKEHDNPDVAALHVALDPRTLLLVRS